MGEYGIVMEEYLRENRRFADLFNVALFQGRQVILASQLQEGSERYQESRGNDMVTGIKKRYTQRQRDIKKLLKTGTSLRILAIESQNFTDYTMPWRCMNYDSLEYGKQLRNIQHENKSKLHEMSPAERLCGIRHGDKLNPVFTLCLYHGEEPWDGPRSLKDMMDFDGGGDCFAECFADYPMNLICINELQDLSGFRTSLKELFRILQYRKDKKGLRRLLETHSEYRHLDEETMEVMAVLMNNRKVLECKERYKNKEGEYDMCQALHEIFEDGIVEGRQEGRQEGVLRVNQLLQALLEASRLDDIERMINDSALQEKLFEEFGL